MFCVSNTSITSHRYPVATPPPPITHPSNFAPYITETPNPSLQEVPTLRQLWAQGQQVVLSYEEEGTVSRHPELWPGIPYWWGNKVKAQDLVCYLEQMKSCGRPGETCSRCPGSTGYTSQQSWHVRLLLVPCYSVLSLPLASGKET